MMSWTMFGMVLLVVVDGFVSRQVIGWRVEPLDVCADWGRLGGWLDGVGVEGSRTGWKGKQGLGSGRCGLAMLWKQRRTQLCRFSCCTIKSVPTPAKPLVVVAA